MTTATIGSAVSSTSRALAAEVRAEMGRQACSQRELARRMGTTQPRVSRRLGTAADVELTLVDVVEMAEALGVDAEGFVIAALRACRDSNPKPSDLYPIGAFVKSSLTVDRRGAIGWGLVA